MLSILQENGNNTFVIQKTSCKGSERGLMQKGDISIEQIQEVINALPDYTEIESIVFTDKEFFINAKLGIKQLDSSHMSNSLSEIQRLISKLDSDIIE